MPCDSKHKVNNRNMQNNADKETQLLLWLRPQLFINIKDFFLNSSLTVPQEMIMSPEIANAL